MPDFPPAADRGVRAAGVPQNGATIAQAALVVVAVLYFARDLLVPLALTVLLAFVLAPISRALRRIGIPRVAAVLAAVLAAVAVIGMLGLVIGRQLAELGGDIYLYQWELTRKLNSINASGGLIERAQDMLRGLAAQAERAVPEPRPSLDANVVHPLPVEVRPPVPKPFELLQSVLAPLIYPLATFGIVVVLVIFVLLYREDLRDRVIRLVGARDLHRTMAAMDDAAYRLSRYFLALTAMNAAYGVFISGALLLIGVPQPILWGIVAGLMRYVPFVGTIVAVAFPLLLALAVEPGWTMPVLVLVLFAFGEGLMGQVLEPLVLGRSTGISPIAVIAAATFWTWLWGPIGLIVAVPLTVCLVVLGRHVERFEFLDVALGDRPPLDPPETFYQRALAGDGDALTEQAEDLLRERRLSAYYDEVALPALALAQADAMRGSFTPERLTALRARVATLIEDLEEEVEDDQPPEPALTEEAKDASPSTVEVQPPPEVLVPPGAVMCVAGRGPFDETAAAMLAQMLRKRGIGAVAAPVELLRGGDLTGLDAGLVRQAWFCTVEGGASVAASRYLLRRMKRRFPEAQFAAFVVGGSTDDRLPNTLRTEGVLAVEGALADVGRVALRLATAPKVPANATQ
ncbi:AI-2E family transporter [Falsiroseomonas sp.]|uniref:AI-2E family transporter n=1 Tax=Falsiroseomonas sp. TaxID=2870721 RepID=UPI002735A2AE|nr:AI-2E family transporter [Falsiroseomonas sp.]MDP3418868.1 AI-2E family transporter [Falsiroseomonas sp.]